MAGGWCIWPTLVVVVMSGSANAQLDDNVNKTMAPNEGYGAGTIVLTVVLTLLIAGALLVAGYYVWIKYWLPKRERHLILETDPERGKDQYAFDNPGFKDAGLTPIAAVIEKNKAENVNQQQQPQQPSNHHNNAVANSKSRWSHWSPLGVLTLKNEKRRAVDDNDLNSTDVKIVALRSHDFTGLGFNICGNMKDGIFIKDLLHRGPASESGKLRTGDRIRSLTINFEHMVFEDALTILSYASPYDVVIEAQGQKITVGNPGPFGQPRHPIYKSASSTDLLQIVKAAKKSLFQDDSSCEVSSNPPPKQSRSLLTTLERKRSKSPKPIPATRHEEYRKSAEKFQEQTQRSENPYAKFGVKVLPMGEHHHHHAPTSPKSAELSQNDNNINLERTHEPDHAFAVGIDEVDKKPVPPPVKKREKFNKVTESTTKVEPVLVTEDLVKNSFEREHVLNSSGIRRDENGIPQEIPSQMFNAAVAARRNRKSAIEEPSVEDTKGLKKGKGKAPSPPEDKESEDAAIQAVKDEQVEQKDYNSDSDMENDTKSSVNTIELNSSDITVHQNGDESDEKQNRRTASTGDLSKIQKDPKPATGTLERAQSLDITDNTNLASLAAKKRKPSDGKLGTLEPLDIEDEQLEDSHEDIIKTTQMNGLNTFERNRLKKSNEWGNLEDAISSFSNEDDKINSNESFKISTENMDDVDFNKIDVVIPVDVNMEIEKVEKEASDLKMDIIKIEQAIKDSVNQIDTHPIIDEVKVNVTNEIWPETVSAADDVTTHWSKIDLIEPPALEEAMVEAHNNVVISQTVENTAPVITQTNFKENIHPVSPKQVDDFLNAERQSSSDEIVNKMPSINVSDDMKVSMGSLERVVRLDTDDFQEEPIVASNRQYISTNMNSSEVLHVKDKYDDEEFESLGNEIVDLSRINISNITIIDEQDDNIPKLHTVSKKDSSNFSVTHLNGDEKSNILNRLNRDNRILPTPDLIQNISIREAVNDINNMVTIDGPSSLSLDVNAPVFIDTTEMKSNGDGHGSDVTSEPDTSKHSSLTYITEIQVTPTVQASKSIEKNLDTEFEKYIKNFEAKSSETSPTPMDTSIDSVITLGGTESSTASSTSAPSPDIQKELDKIQQIADQQLKRLPEMRFSTSTYRSQNSPPNQMLAKRAHSQIEILRSNFERISNNLATPPRSMTGKESSPPKSRIPVALPAMKTPPTSPERRDSRVAEPEPEFVEILNATPSWKYKPNSNGNGSNGNRNVTVTSIRSNSKIPSGLPTYNRSLSSSQMYTRKSEHENGNNDRVQVVTNGGDSNSFKQWVFNPNASPNGTATSVTNITISPIDHHK